MTLSHVHTTAYMGIIPCHTHTTMLHIPTQSASQAISHTNTQTSTHHGYTHMSILYSYVLTHMATKSVP